MAGSLLELHSHNNLTTLDALSEISGLLYYKGKKVAGAADLSAEPDNAIITKDDGIYVNGKLLCSEEEKKLLARLTIDPVQGLMLDNKQVGHSHSNKSVLDNFTEDNTDGLLYKGTKVIHSHENKGVLDKFSIDRAGSLLYNGIKLETELKISSASSNAIQEKVDGLYVEDKTETIAETNKSINEIKQTLTETGNTIQTVAGNVADVKSDVDGILDSIERGETFLGVDIDWITIRTSGTQNQVVAGYLKPDEHLGNMVFNENIITLRPNRNYMAIATLRIDGGSQLCYTIQDIDTLECFGTGVANATQYETNYGEQSLMTVIPTGSTSRRVAISVFDSQGSPTYQGLNVVIAEIGRAVELPHAITSTDIDDAVQDTLRILNAVDETIEQLNMEV